MRWHRIEAGVYEATAQDGTRYRIEKLDLLDYEPHRGERARWNCYANGEVFDAGSTLAEAKRYCGDSK